MLEKNNTKLLSLNLFPIEVGEELAPSVDMRLPILGENKNII